MNKYAILMALVGATAADSTIDYEIGDYSLQGSTQTKDNVTVGSYTFEGEKDGKPMSEQVNYLVTGDKEDKESRTVVKELIKKFDQYFYYAMETKNLEIGQVEHQCTIDSQCGKEGDVKTKCCVNAIMQDKESNTEDQIYRCMSKTVADANMDMKINDMTVSMRCASSAAYMSAAFAASAASLAAMTLY